MLIGIDASRIEQNNKTGIEYYAYEVITRMVALDKKNEYILYSRKPLNLEFPTNAKNKVLSFPLFWTHVRLSVEMIVNPPDILFIPAHTIPLFYPKNTVTVIHGLEYEFFPAAYSFLQRLKNRLGTYYSAKWARGIIVPSRNTKNDLVGLYGVNPEKINVVYPGFKGIEHEHDTASTTSPPHLLFLGRIEHRKNVIRIIKAFEKLKKEKKIPHQLILAGGNGYGFHEIKECINGSEYKEEIHLVSFVQDREKNILLARASVFVFPTLYEGFGFPILEAMSAGVPVVTSKAGSSVEIASDAALLVDPKIIDEIADSVYKIISDGGVREELVRKGYENVKRFRWEKCVVEIMNYLFNITIQ